MKTNKEVVNRLREFTQNNCNTTLDPKLCEDIRYLCDEVERFGVQMLLMNEYGDEDYITIQKYKSKLEKCQAKLSNYEPF
jgi:hypothetical protein